MSAYNDSRLLPASIESVIEQEGVDFEFIIIDDGSTDNTPQILKHYSDLDARIRLVRQENQGLTRALILGCNIAVGEFVARQDVGDISLPGRLSAQSAALVQNQQLSFVSCRHELVGPEGEMLTDSVPSDGGVNVLNSLKDKLVSSLTGPHHGTVMFRKKHYDDAGGYRSQFYFAQDLDLWTRLIEVGDLEFIDETLYRVVFEPTSITARWRDK